MLPGHDRTALRPTRHVGLRHGRVAPPGPPTLAAWLLACLAPRTVRDVALGDLYEEYVAFAVVELGPRRARRWYWRQVLALLVRYRTPFCFLARCAGDALGSKRRLALGMLAHEACLALRTLRATSAYPRTAVVALASAVGVVAALLNNAPRAVSAPPALDVVADADTVGQADTGYNSPAAPPPERAAPAPTAVASERTSVTDSGDTLARSTPPAATMTSTGTADVPVAGQDVALDSTLRGAATAVIVGMDPVVGDSGKQPPRQSRRYDDDLVHP